MVHAMTTKKWITLAIYTLLALYAISFHGSTASRVIIWIFIALPVAHLLEYCWVQGMLKEAPGSQANHFIQTLLFGFVHWLPIKQAGERK